MNAIKAITHAIAQLPPEQVAQVRTWLAEYDKRSGRADRQDKAPVDWTRWPNSAGRTSGWTDAASMTHHTTADFWECYARLPEAVRRLADSNYEMLRRGPASPVASLQACGAAVVGASRDRLSGG